MMSALWMLAPIRMKEATIKFIEQIYSGKGDIEEAYYLRDKFLKERMVSKKTNKSYLFGILIKCFNSYITGSKIKVFKILEGESFPKINGN
jgi:hypothetical protein